MPFYSYRKHSKTDFGTSNEFPTLEQMNTGSLQRIADAIEKIAVNYTKMEKEIKDKNREIKRLERVIAKLREIPPVSGEAQ